MNKFLEWCAMGGYSIYVWPAYGLVCSVLLGQVIALKWHKKRVQRQLVQWFNAPATSRCLSAGTKILDPADKPRDVVTG